MHLVFTPLSLRARLFGTIGLVVLPLAVMAFWAIDSHHRTVQDFDRLTARSTQRLEATIHLQNLVLETSTLRTQETLPAETRRVSLTRNVRSVETVFRKVLDGPGLGPLERRIVEGARRDWRRELARSDVVPGRSARTPGQAAYLLGTLADAYRHESGRLRQQLVISQQRLLWMLSVAVLVCLVIAAGGAAILSRSLLEPLYALRQGVAHFAGNDLSYRLPTGRLDEFGQLAQEINRMAEHFEVHQRELQELSSHDSLTGLLNRREFAKRLQAEQERGRRYGQVFSVIMVDIDHFKDINDRYGHPGGDEVLTTIADLMQLNVRPMDVVSRYGGEEFAILLPETGSSGAFSLAERMRQAVAKSAILISSNQMVRVTISLGVATFMDNSTIEPLAVADQALYRAKRSGRNRVVADNDVPLVN